MKPEPVNPAKPNTSISQRFPESKKYVVDELVRSKLSVPVVEVLSRAGNYYAKNCWETINLERNFIKLQELNPTSEQLLVLEEVINDFQELGGGFDGILEDYIKLIRANPTSEQLHLITRATKASSIEVYGLIGNFAELVEANPHPHLWTVLDKAATHHKFTDTDKLAKSLSRISKTTISYNQIEFFNNVIDWSIRKERDVIDLCKNFADFFEAKPSEDVLKLLEEGIEYYQSKGWGLDKLVKPYCKVAKINPIKESLELLRDSTEIIKIIGNHLDTSIELFCKLVVGDFVPPNVLADIVRESIGRKNIEDELKEKISRLINKSHKKLPAEKVKLLNCLLIYRQISGTSRNKKAEQYIESLVKADSPLLSIFDIYSKAAFTLQRSCDFRSREDLRRYLGELVGHNLEYLDSNHFAHSIQLFRNYSMGIIYGHIDRPEELSKLFAELTAQTAITTVTRSDNTQVIDRAKQTIEHVTRGDSLPFLLRDEMGTPNPEAKRAYEETLQVYSRAYNFYHGFGSLTFDAKRPPGKEPALLARFGKDVAQRICYINAKDFNSFPGKGFLIEGIKSENVFVQDTNAQDPLWKYKKAWGWAEHVFDDLPKTTFIFTRGMIIVSCADSSKYSLKGRDGTNTHYNYIVFNDHFHNYFCDTALLIPTEILNKKLKNTAIPYEDYTGFMPSKPDINEAGFTLRDLKKACEEMDANLINLGWSSNFNGGLCNAFLPGSLPYHEWERKLRGHTQDSSGHIHKSHLTWSLDLDEDIISRADNLKIERLLMPLRHAHFSVYTVTNRYQNLLDLFRISLALWHKGQTAGEIVRPPDVSDDELFEGEPELIEELTESSEYGQNSNRMLIEAYKWHSARKEGKTDKNDFPIVVIADTLDYWNIPKSPVTLDTYNMVLQDEKNMVQLPEESDGTDIIERKLWEKYFLSQAQSTGKDIRFLDRRFLGLK